jgi:hypothetical protein
MISDDFCKAFDCTMEIEYKEDCFEYVKGVADINCHLYCALENCTHIPIAEVMCLQYDCWPKSTTTTPPPTPPPIPSPTSEVGVIVGSIFAAVLFVVILGIAAWKFRKRSQLLREDERLHLLGQSENLEAPQEHPPTSPSTSSSEEVILSESQNPPDEGEDETPGPKREFLQKIRAWRPFAVNSRARAEMSAGQLVAESSF